MHHDFAVGVIVINIGTQADLSDVFDINKRKNCMLWCDGPKDSQIDGAHDPARSKCTWSLESELEEGS